MWQAFLSREPFPTEKVAMQLAYLTSIVLTRWKKEGAPAVKPDACLLFGDAWPDENAGDQDVESMIAGLRQIFPEMREAHRTLDQPEQE